MRQVNLAVIMSAYKTQENVYGLQELCNITNWTSGKIILVLLSRKYGSICYQTSVQNSKFMACDICKEQNRFNNACILAFFNLEIAKVV